ncbi:MAG: cytochrome b/b6 domain-containing protein [Solirubrobacteraceae bacterium]
MTATPGSDAPTATAERGAGYVRRFDRTERAVHWIHAVAFFGMLATGLALYLPALSGAIGRRDLVRDLHLIVAIGWMVALLAVCLGGNRHSLRRALAEIEVFDRDDLRWLRGRRAPQGRFNAGQKLHAVLQTAFAVLFTVSGVLLWLGERNTTFRLSGTVVLHDALTFLALLFVVGHLYLALLHPSTRPALRGIVRGTVRRDWAAEHHARWRPEEVDAPVERDEIAGRRR